MEATLKSFAQNIPNSEEVCSVCGARIFRTAEFMGIKPLPSEAGRLYND